MTDQPERQNPQEIARQNRLARALRENLKRRKSQSRGRADQPADKAADLTATPTDSDDPSQS